MIKKQSFKSNIAGLLIINKDTNMVHEDIIKGKVLTIHIHHSIQFCLFRNPSRNINTFRIFSLNSWINNAKLVVSTLCFICSIWCLWISEGRTQGSCSIVLCRTLHDSCRLRPVSELGKNLSSSCIQLKLTSLNLSTVIRRGARPVFDLIRCDRSKSWM